jgi:hypothetical protein
MMDLMRIVNNLPDEIQSIIISYLPYNKIKFLNREQYKLTYSKNIPRCLKISFETYIRKIVVDDLDFVFNVLLDNNLYRWINMKKYRHNQIIFINYIYFLKYFSLENNSKKCSALINSIIDITGLDRKQHKNKINRNIIWIK